MNNHLFPRAVFALLALVASELQAGNREKTPGHEPNMNAEHVAEADKRMPGEVVFFDDFERSSSVPDPAWWEYVPAGTAPWQHYMSGEPDDARIEEGRLRLRARKENGVYRCGGIRTLGRIAFGPGHRIEVRARIRRAQGAWAAAWLMPEPDGQIYPGWPDGGEIDIMEQLGHEEFVYQTVHSHYVHHHTPAGSSGDQRTVRIDVEQFHDYAVEMTDEALIFSVDGRETFRHVNKHLDDEAQKRQWPFRCRYYLILNLALGGWAGEIDDAELPAEMEVEHVRVTKCAGVRRENEWNNQTEKNE